MSLVMSKTALFAKRCKYDHSAYPGLLQLQPMPTTVWESITMDFIKGLPKSQVKEVIMVVIDKLRNYAHFISSSHPYTVIEVAQVSQDNMYKLLEFLTTITSDRDKVFISKFQIEFFKLKGG